MTDEREDRIVEKLCIEREYSKKLKAALKRILPIVEAAFWDHHTAGTLPGAGYNNKAEHLAGQEFGWRDSKRFQEWAKEMKHLLGE